MRKVRKGVSAEVKAQNPNAKAVIIEDEPVRKEFLNYLRAVMGDFKYFDKNTPKMKKSPFEFLDYDRMVLILAEELLKELWLNITFFTVNDSLPNVLWSAESIKFNFIYYILFI